MIDFEAAARARTCGQGPLAEALRRWLDGGGGDGLAALIVALELAASGDPEAPLPRRRTEPGAATVLLAEDFAALRPVLRRVLEAGGFRVLEAADAGEALAAFEAHIAEVVALVSDLSLRPCGGPELARRLRQRRPGLRVLLIGNEAAGPDPAGLPLLEKPFAPDALVGRLRDLLGGGG
jgi:CheY-like chemotaxis protein